MSSAALFEVISQKKHLSKSDKEWFTSSLKRIQKHESELAVLRVMAQDPEMKFFLGMGAGASIAWLGTILGETKEGQDGTPAPGGEPIDLGNYKWLLRASPLGGVAVTAGQITGIFDTGPNLDGGISGNFGQILQLGGTGFAGTCAMILILRAIFSGTDLGELASAIGELVPL